MVGRNQSKKFGFDSIIRLLYNPEVLLSGIFNNIQDQLLQNFKAHNQFIYLFILRVVFVNSLEWFLELKLTTLPILLLVFNINSWHVIFICILVVWMINNILRILDHLFYLHFLFQFCCLDLILHFLEIFLLTLEPKIFHFWLRMKKVLLFLQRKLSRLDIALNHFGLIILHLYGLLI